MPVYMLDTDIASYVMKRSKPAVLQSSVLFPQAHYASLQLRIRSCISGLNSHSGSKASLRHWRCCWSTFRYWTIQPKLAPTTARSALISNRKER